MSSVGACVASLLSNCVAQKALQGKSVTALSLIDYWRELKIVNNTVRKERRNTFLLILKGYVAAGTPHAVRVQYVRKDKIVNRRSS